MAKKKAPPERKHNFPLVFRIGLRERATVVAEAMHGGNLTHLVNTAVEQYVTSHEQKKSKK